MLVRIPAKRGPIWVTDLYAISAFKSACRRQINAEINLPQIARAIRGIERVLLEV